jgi:hypothetical protein
LLVEGVYAVLRHHQLGDLGVILLEGLDRNPLQVAANQGASPDDLLLSAASPEPSLETGNPFVDYGIM